MKITIDEKIAALKEYVRCFPCDSEVYEMLKEHLVAKALEISPDEVMFWDNECDVFYLDSYPNLRVAKDVPAARLPKTDSYYIYGIYPDRGYSLWSTKDNIDMDYYYELFITELMEYNPIVTRNKTLFIYDLEHGKKLMQDYRDILNSFEKKIYDSSTAIEDEKEFKLYKKLKEKFEGEEQ